jgi:hypothetical protein
MVSWGDMGRRWECGGVGGEGGGVGGGMTCEGGIFIKKNIHNFLKKKYL